jgi:hypothetical protein
MGCPCLVGDRNVTTYCLGICDLCARPMTLLEITEGVGWEERERDYPFGFGWWCEPEEEARIAHRRCWKDLKEWERRRIRKAADEAPRSMGQMV